MVLLPAPFGPSSPTAPAGNVDGHVAQRLVAPVADVHSIQGNDGIRHLLECVSGTRSGRSVVAAARSRTKARCRHDPIS